MADKRLLIDTSLLIDYFRSRDKNNSRLVQLSKQFDRLFISSITEFEVYSGATPGQLGFWRQLLLEIQVLPFDSKAAHSAAAIQQNLKKSRKSIDKADLFIAATAMSNNLRLDTLNRRHFESIEHLALV
jgi:predicted nucleic acid-binding protein